VNLWDAIKSRMRHSRYGGSTTAPSGPLSDWLHFGHFPGTGFDYAGVAGDVRLNAVVQACLAWIQRTFPEAPVQVVKVDAAGEENEVPGHGLTKLMRAPNPATTAANFWEQVLADFIPTGNAYARKIRNAAGKVIEVWNVPETRIRPQWDTSGREFIGHYLISIDGQPEKVPVADIIHFKFGRNPQNERLGWSPLLAGLREVAALNAGGAFRGALLHNHAAASYLVTPKEGQSWTPDQARALESRWFSKLKGDGAGKPIFSNTPLEAALLNYSPKDLDLAVMLHWDSDTLASLLGLSAQVLNLTSGHEAKTYANYAEAREAAYEQCILPLKGIMAAWLQLQLLPDFGDPETERVAHDLSQVRILQEDQNKLWGRVNDAMKCPTRYLTVNEARALLGQPSLGKEYDTLEGPEPETPAFQPESSGDAAVQVEQPEPAVRSSNGR